MINFDGAILIDLDVDTSEPGSNDPIGLQVYGHRLINSLDEAREVICEGCGYWGAEQMVSTGDRHMYKTFPLQSTGDPMSTPVLVYCQNCMEDIKKAWDMHPNNISGFGDVLPWFHAQFLSGHQNGVWKEFE